MEWINPQIGRKKIKGALGTSGGSGYVYNFDCGDGITSVYIYI